MFFTPVIFYRGIFFERMIVLKNKEISSVKKLAVLGTLAALSIILVVFIHFPIFPSALFHAFKSLVAPSIEVTYPSVAPLTTKYPLWFRMLPGLLTYNPSVQPYQPQSHTFRFHPRFSAALPHPGRICFPLLHTQGRCRFHFFYSLQAVRNTVFHKQGRSSSGSISLGLLLRYLHNRNCPCQNSSTPDNRENLQSNAPLLFLSLSRQISESLFVKYLYALAS